MNKSLLYIGHRGTNVDCDENTIEAFNKVIQAGATYLEFDLRLTKDRQLVVMHNPKIDETTNGHGYVKDLLLKDIKNVRTKKNNQIIPTLDEVLDIFSNQQKIKFIIDLKERKISPIVLEKIQSYNLLDRSYICSANFEELKLAKKTLPETKICYVVYRQKRLNDILHQIVNGTLKLKIDMLSVAYPLVTPVMNRLCQDNQISTLSWGFRHIEGDHLSWIRQNIADGINGIIFDDYNNIPLIRKWLQGK